MPNLRTLASLAVLSACALACSSKNEPAQTTPPPPGDTGTVEDTTPPPEDTPPPWATYPDGPYGIDKKDQVFPNLEFEGYKGGAGGEYTKIKMIDYYDPDGTRGINALLVVVSAEWCGPCRTEAAALPGMLNTLYKPRGGVFMGALIEDTKSNPADQATLDRWIKAFKTNFDLVADPDKGTMPASSPIPRNYIINPRTMKIYRINIGTSSDPTSVPGMKALLDYNGAPPLPDAGAPDTAPPPDDTASPVDSGAPTDAGAAG